MRTAATPGSLVALPQLPHCLLCWCVVAQSVADPNVVLVVPCDDLSLAYARYDVSLEWDDKHPLAPLALRCAHGVWIASEALVGAVVLGRLEEWLLVEALSATLDAALDGSRPDWDEADGKGELVACLGLACDAVEALVAALGPAVRWMAPTARRRPRALR